MSVGMIKRAVIYIKEVQDINFFSIMANSRLFSEFTGSPQFFVMLPLMSIWLTVIALIDTYNLAIASNKNLDKWLHFIVSGTCAILSSISIYGSIVSALLGVTFAASSWLFFSSVLVGCLHQTVLLCLNLIRAFESPKHTIQRMHYLQAAINNGFYALLMCSILGGVVFTMLSPVAPVVGSTLAITAVVLTIIDILWQLLPPLYKAAVKNFFYVGKPEMKHQIPENQVELVQTLKSSKTIDSDTHFRFFTQKDYALEIQNLDVEQAKQYLCSVIEIKLSKLSQGDLPQNDKVQQKINALNLIHSYINSQAPFLKKQLLEQYPLAFQSFWAEIGEVEQIVNAALNLQKNFENSRARTISLDSSLSQPSSRVFSNV